MIDRITVGEIPRKHHIALRGPQGDLRYEECFTRDGFDGPYTIMYHLARPHTQALANAQHGWAEAVAADTEATRPLAKRHYKTFEQHARGGPPVDALTALLFNDDLTSGVAFPDADDPVLVSNADGDMLIYVHQGGGVLRSALGDLAFSQGDYVYIPAALPHRFILCGHEGKTANAAVPQYWCWFEFKGGMHLLKQFRNEAGQLRMDAPYSHRDFKRPTFIGPTDDGVRDLVVKRGGRWHGFTYQDAPLDVVGWDGSVYPFAFPILNFQPRVSSVHLPPTWHGTFAARGALVCSFVPRLVDFHPEAIPCPYPHSSPACDEIIFYCDGNFTSRRGVAPGSISHHPTGVPHGPHPGAYERSIGTTRTDELAVMLDCFKPLQATAAALAVEDASYQQSFI
ncbi:MAG: homogentisate 1,2-dioxygenase [Myxococcales bacterium]|nr:homogentisate 1,2-dioxygenase [Myxococcales bacterium]